MALRNRQLAALAFFIAMAVLHSWPLASDPSHLARLDNHDAELNTWIIAWVAHQLPRDPLNLFEAPILYPEPHSLAFSEHMFVPAVMGAPLLWAGASPVLVYNILIMIGFALSGWAMYLLMTRWTGSQWAGIIAGLLYGFNAHVLTRFVHLQAQHVEFFPLVLYAFDRVLVPSTALSATRLKDAVLLAAAFVLQALCSNYLLVFTTYALIAAALVRWRESVNSRVPLAIAAVISMVALAPFLWPYYQVDRDQHLARTADVVTQYNAGWRDYLATGGRLHYAWWSAKFYEGRTALFPGVAGIVLAGWAMASTRTRRDPRVRMVIAIGVVGAAFSFGTSLPGYAVLHGALPLLSGLRNVARWGWLVLAAIAILAGFAVAAIEQHFAKASASAKSAADSTVGRRSWTRAIPFAICVVVTIEAIRTPVGYTRFNGIPRFYDRFADEPAVVLAEFPFYAGANVSLNGPYVLANTRYFKPLLNGYSSFHPESFERRGRALNSFPSEVALAELRVAHVTHVVVHSQPFARRYGAAALAAIDTIPELEFLAGEEGVRIYRLK